MLARVAAIGPLAARSAQVAELADTTTGIGGQNTLRMRLTAFVLAARLEKVAALANERLRVMGDGRYQLAHSDDLAAGGRRSGLGWWCATSGPVRSATPRHYRAASRSWRPWRWPWVSPTLCGEGRWVRPHTLFIDEGFGTLDDESLEQVMSVLDGLRERPVRRRGEPRQRPTLPRTRPGPRRQDLDGVQRHRPRR